jgi:hypothetical protein
MDKSGLKFFVIVTIQSLLANWNFPIGLSNSLKFSKKVEAPNAQFIGN